MIGHLPGRDQALGSFGWTGRDGRTVDRHSESCTSRREQFHAGDFPFPPPSGSTFRRTREGRLPGAPMGALPKPLAARSSGFGAVRNDPERPGTVGSLLKVDALAQRSSAFGA